MFGFTLAGALKLLGSLLTPKNLLYAAITIAVLWGGFKGYNWIYDRGAAHQLAEDQKQITTLTGERDEARTDLAAYKKEYQNWVDNTKLAQEQFMREQAGTIKVLQDDLKAAEAKAAQREVVYRDIPKYIPAEVDATVHLPVGFIRVYSETLQGTAASDASLGTISFGPGGNAAAPSGITLSGFAEIAGWNNMECVRRGRLLHAWQFWYDESREQFTRAQQVQADSIPKVTEPAAGSTP